MKVLAAGALLVTAISTSPHSKADNYVHALTLVEWQGTACVIAAGPSLGNAYVIGTPSTTCMYGPPGSARWAQWEQGGYSGQYVGIDPIMGANNWIKCTVYINGRIEKVDYASAGDGSDVNCLRVVNY